MIRINKWNLPFCSFTGETCRLYICVDEAKLSVCMVCLYCTWCVLHLHLGKRVMRNLFRIPLLEAYSIYKASMMSIHLTDFFPSASCVYLCVCMPCVSCAFWSFGAR